MEHSNSGNAIRVQFSFEVFVFNQCKRMSNQTAGEEQRGEYKGGGHGGEGATPQGKASDAHVLKVLQILTMARGMPGHDIKIVMENPANAGLEKLVGPGGMFEHKIKREPTSFLYNDIDLFHWNDKCIGNDTCKAKATKIIAPTASRSDF